MPREHLASPDFKAPVFLNGSPGSSGQIPYSGGPSAPPSWGDPPGGGPGGESVGGRLYLNSVCI